MLVYGDAERIEDQASAWRHVDAALTIGCDADLDQCQAALLRAYIAAAELVQGVADRSFDARGYDEATEEEDLGVRALTVLAAALDVLWHQGRLDRAALAAARRLVRPLDGSGRLRIRTAEGFALYALFPQTYLAAARQSALPPGTAVVGIRSIGSALAPLVAAGLGAAAAVTLRPIGHPFARRVTAGPLLAARLAADQQPVAVVDEGPGLSGSSFAAVAQWLTAQGVAPQRIHFFPSHAGGPGDKASTAVRQLWAGTPCHVASFDDTILNSPRFQGALERLVGPLANIPQPVSGRDRFAPLTFRVSAGGADWLLRFAGLGESGPRKLAISRRLAAEGFAPPVAGLCFGFLVERALPGRALRDAPVPPAALMARLAAYLGLRACSFPAPTGGASPAQLAEMTNINVAEGLGERAAAALAPRLTALSRWTGSIVRVVTDNHLHSDSWLVLEDGRLIKTEAADHAFGHDLIGCQPIVWDVAGAAIEFGLDAERTGQLAAAVARGAGQAVDPRLVEALWPCYLAFQLGRATIAGQRVRAAVYRAKLAELSAAGAAFV